MSFVAVALSLTADATANAQRPHPARRAASSDTVCVVARVSDGDTIRCRDGRRVRLLLIDAPERSQPPFGQRAAARLAEFLPVGSTARLQFDVERMDQYGRVLAYVYRGGQLVNLEMVRSGFAVVLVYPPNVRYVEQMRAAAASARAEKRGLWAVDAFSCSPRDHRQRRC